MKITATISKASPRYQDWMTAFLAQKFSLPENEIVKDLAVHGVPILAEGLTIAGAPDVRMAL